MQSLQSIKQKEVLPGYKARFIHSEKMTLAYWEIEENARLPEHKHVHEQVVNMLEGTYELTVEGIPNILNAGDILVIPSNVPHSGLSLTPCRILDVFCPVREEYL